ncbi:outer membrane lipoprotein-sorting protein [Parahaliea aestuarii]|uniref:outer membrane lipoprotein-sorting protein n=1 Tax=Parahaliea aestuarii TaxID=1852021 RepID=UPI001C9CA804|nr:outer membrane lipoprotein-sorting protein [Parahaliea aestuarii]
MKPVYLLFLALLPIAASAADDAGHDIMQKVNARPDGEQVRRDFTISTTDRRGVTRVEKTIAYRKYFGADKRTVMFYTEPTNVRGTGFLTFDYSAPTADDDQWLYLPALRKIRRISSSNRGDSFLGTDLSYEEIKKENKVEISDYRFTLLEETTCLERPGLLVEAIPVSDRIAEELGYSKVHYCIDPAIWMARHVEFWDIAGNHLKTISIDEVQEIDGVWTSVDLQVVNHKTQHRTRLQQDNIDYSVEIDDQVFTQPYLRRGLR